MSDAKEESPKRWAVLAVLAMGCFLGMCPWFSASAVLPPLLLRYGIPESQGGLVTIAVQLGFVCGALASAALNLADIFSPRKLVVVGALGAAAANLGLLTAPDFISVLALRFATGLGLSLVYPPYLKIAASWFHQGRGTALGIMLGGLTVGSAAPHLAKAVGSGDWRRVIFATSVAGLLGGLLAALTARDGPFPFQRGAFAPRQALQIFKHRGLRLVALGYFGHMWELYAMWAWFPVFAAERFGLAGYSTEAAAWYVFGVIASGAAGCYVAGKWGDRWGRTKVVRLALALSGGSAAIIGMTPFAAFLVVGVVWGLAVNADSAQFTALTSELADQAYVGTVLAIQLALGFLLTNATLWSVPVIHMERDWAAAFLWLGIGPLVGIAAMGRLAGFHRELKLR